MRRPALDQIARARAAWGDAPPVEIVALAEACKAQTSRAVARRLGVSDTQISQALGNRYASPLAPLFAKVRGVFLGETVECPGYGMEIARDQCLREQARPFAATNSSRARLFQECKRCEHRTKKEKT